MSTTDYRIDSGRKLAAELDRAAELQRQIECAVSRMRVTADIRWPQARDIVSAAADRLATEAQRAHDEIVAAAWSDVVTTVNAECHTDAKVTPGAHPGDNKQ